MEDATRSTGGKTTQNSRAPDRWRETQARAAPRHALPEHTGTAPGEAPPTAPESQGPVTGGARIGMWDVYSSSELVCNPTRRVTKKSTDRIGRYSPRVKGLVELAPSRRRYTPSSVATTRILRTASAMRCESSHRPSMGTSGDGTRWKASGSRPTSYGCSRSRPMN